MRMKEALYPSINSMTLAPFALTGKGGKCYVVVAYGDSRVKVEGSGWDLNTDNI